MPANAAPAAPQVETPAPVAAPVTQAVEPPVSNLVLPVAEEPVALVPDLEPKAPPAIPERQVAEPAQPEPEPAPAAAATVSEQAKPGFFARLKQGLSKTSASIGEGMASLFLGKKVIDDDLLDEIETRLLTADVGVEATSAIVQNLTQKVARKQLADADALYKSLQEELAALLRPVEQPLKVQAQNKPYVILVVGVNGAGKTTTIGKLAKKLQLEGKKVMLAAGDTFRAAAVEQLQVWGERNQIPVIAQHTGADSASVIFDAVQAAKARGADVLIADTAGRLHTKDNLMEEPEEGPPGDWQARRRCAARGAVGTRCRHRPERHQPGQVLQPKRRTDRPGPDQAGRHRQRRGDLRLGQTVQHPDPLHRCG
ncbi:Signal recognition particle receptor FtsY [Pseudomonas sp. MM223]|nr:Signal recognition particle receptor FtsY [Pseudomonas sp. MM223]